MQVLDTRFWLVKNQVAFYFPDLRSNTNFMQQGQCHASILSINITSDDSYLMKNIKWAVTTGMHFMRDWCRMWTLCVHLTVLSITGIKQIVCFAHNYCCFKMYGFRSYSLSHGAMHFPWWLLILHASITVSNLNFAWLGTAAEADNISFTAVKLGLREWGKYA